MSTTTLSHFAHFYSYLCKCAAVHTAHCHLAPISTQRTHISQPLCATRHPFPSCTSVSIPLSVIFIFIALSLYMHILSCVSKHYIGHKKWNKKILHLIFSFHFHELFEVLNAYTYINYINACVRIQYKLVFNNLRYISLWGYTQHV